MAEKAPKSNPNEGIGEKGLRYYRNFNVAVGGVALAGTMIVPPLLIPPLLLYGGFNVAQAGGAEVARRFVRNRKNTKSTSKN
jgi:hypothetical protein